MLDDAFFAAPSVAVAGQDVSAFKVVGCQVTAFDAIAYCCVAVCCTHRSNVVTVEIQCGDHTFTELIAERLTALIAGTALEVEQSWATEDLRVGCTVESWFNALYATKSNLLG